MLNTCPDYDMDTDIVFFYQIRYLKMEQWCQMDNGTHYIDVLDMVSIVLAILIVAVVSKVYYDYWNFKTKGKLPWLVGKM